MLGRARSTSSARGRPGPRAAGQRREPPRAEERCAAAASTGAHSATTTRCTPQSPGLDADCRGRSTQPAKGAVVGCSRSTASPSTPVWVVQLPCSRAWSRRLNTRTGLFPRRAGEAIRSQRRRRRATPSSRMRASPAPSSTRSRPMLGGARRASRSIGFRKTADFGHVTRFADATLTHAGDGERPGTAATLLVSGAAGSLRVPAGLLRRQWCADGAARRKARPAPGLPDAVLSVVVPLPRSRPSHGTNYLLWIVAYVPIALALLVVNGERPSSAT